MHELSVTTRILEIVVEHAQAAKAHHVTHIYLVIGQLSSIINDSVQFYWDIVCENTLAAGAQLHFRRVPAEILCLDCNTRYGLSTASIACPACGSESIRIVSGEEFYVDSIDVEMAETPQVD